MANFQPVIKWSGSKRTQVDEIIKYFPKRINTYYEPFVGGASMLRKLMECSDSIQVDKYVCSDLNKGLIDLWNIIKEEPSKVSSYYEKLWRELNIDDNKERKKQYFYKVRERYNKEHNALDFMFIMRTTTNGMPRYNENGDFNNSFHVTRDGITPDKLRKIVTEWSALLNKHNVEFRYCNFTDIVPTENDFIYLDPPYANTKGMYFGNFNQQTLFDYLRRLKCGFLMSYDGKSGDNDNTFDVPKDLYNEHLYIRSGNSSFRRVIGKSKDSIVYESLYLKNNK